MGFNRFAQSGVNFAWQASRPGPLPGAAIGGRGAVRAGQRGYEFPAMETGGGGVVPARMIAVLAR